MRARAAMGVMLALLAAACADDDRSTRVTEPVAPGEIVVDDAAPGVGLDPCALLSADEIERVVDERYDGPFRVEQPVRIAEVCNWDVEFPDVGGTYVQVGATTGDEAAARTGDAPEVHGIGHRGAFRDDPRYGPTLYVTVVDVALIVATGDLGEGFLGHDGNEEVAIAIAELALPRLASG